MLDPEDKDYVSTLNEYSLEKAIRELHEDPKQRLGAVQTLRAWIRSQPHFSCRVDTDFLLQVLRTAKFSQLRAREIIENILTMRTKCPQYMVNLDTHDKGLLMFIEKGVIVPLPKLDKEGRRVMLLRTGITDPSDPLMSVANEMRCSLSVQEMLKEKEENTIVNGVLLVFDLTGMTMKHLGRMGRDTGKDTTKIYQDANTGRVKGFHFYNTGVIFETMMSIMGPLMKKKNMERVRVHSTMESLYTVIPMELWPDEYLPDDYKGPSAGPLQAICDDIKRRLMDPSFRTRLLDYTSDRYKIDEKKRIKDIPQESFRKLSID